MTERKTRANGRASRESILAAALEMFAERGQRGTSLTEIAKRVGITQPGLRHHFATKEHLLLEVVQQRETETEQDFRALVTSGELHIRSAIEALARINEGSPVHQLLLTTLSAEALPADHPLHDHFVARYRRVRAALTQALEEGQAAGAIRDDVNLGSVAKEIIATLDGMHLQWLLDPDEVDLKQSLSDYALRLSRDLAPRG